MSEDRYQDYVIKDGQLVGDFESVYEKFEDPWHQSRVDHPLVTRRSIALVQCMHLRGIDPTGQVNRVVEIGCGFGHLTDSLRQQGFSAVGTDVSATAVTIADRALLARYGRVRTARGPEARPQTEAEGLTAAQADKLTRTIG